MGITKETTPDLYRRGLQYVGTDLCRAANPDHWVNLFRAMLRSSSCNPIIICDDIRFSNEASLCDLLFFILRLSPNGSPITPNQDHPLHAHESEAWNLSHFMEYTNPPPIPEGKSCLPIGPPRTYLIRNREGFAFQAALEALSIIEAHLLCANPSSTSAAPTPTATP